MHINKYICFFLSTFIIVSKEREIKDTNPAIH